MVKKPPVYGFVADAKRRAAGSAIDTYFCPKRTSLEWDEDKPDTVIPQTKRNPCKAAERMILELAVKI